MAVTKQSEPAEGMYQTATEVKVLSPVILHVKEADSFHVLEGDIDDLARVRGR